MAFAIVLICTAAASFALKPAIKKVPWAWYAASVLLVAAYIAGVRGVLPAWADGAVFLLMQKGTLATALFVVVMFIGVFPRIPRFVGVWGRFVLSCPSLRAFLF